MRGKHFTIAALAVMLAGSYGSAMGAMPAHSLWGNPAPLSAAQRSITIEPGTKSVNVQGGEIVRFHVGDKAFAWEFSVPLSTNNIELNRVAPPDMLDHTVTAYITRDPRYLP